MCTLQDMDLNQKFNQSVTDGRCTVSRTYRWTDKGNTICQAVFPVITAANSGEGYVIGRFSMFVVCLLPK